MDGDTGRFSSSLPAFSRNCAVHSVACSSFRYQIALSRQASSMTTRKNLVAGGIGAGAGILMAWFILVRPTNVTDPYPFLHWFSMPATTILIFLGTILRIDVISDAANLAAVNALSLLSGAIVMAAYSVIGNVLFYEYRKRHYFGGGAIAREK
jgi:hypothetical protein